MNTPSQGRVTLSARRASTFFSPNTSSRTAFTKGISECRPSGGRSLT